MKLIRFGEAGHEKPGVVLSSGKMIDVSEAVSDYDTHFLGSWGINDLEGWLNNNAATAPEVPKGSRLGTPVTRPGKIICIGLNFKEQCSRKQYGTPKEPVVFFKATSSLSGPHDPVIIPRGSQKTDWEVELAIVIGKKASYVTEQEAMNHVAGYCLHNDYSERAFQLEQGGQWVKGKSADTFAPLGPGWLPETKSQTRTT